jgi:FKBP-type peptidyl-prolyl cis-trans isomerase
MNKHIFLFSTLVLITLLSCNKSRYDQFELTESGLHFRIVSTGSSKQINDGDILTLDLKYFSIKDSLLFDSKRLGRPFMIKVEKSEFKGDLMEGFKLLHNGDSAQFILSADSFFTKTLRGELPKEFKKGSDIKFAMRVKSVQTEKDFKAMQQKEMDKRKDMAEKNKQAEDSLISKYIAEQKITQKPDKNGIYVIEKKKGKGALVSKGDTILVHYRGSLLNGKVFDSSYDRGEPAKFPIGIGMVISGWDEAIPGMHAGSEARLIIPSAKAYGAMENERIPAFSPLVFDIEIKKVIKSAKP